MLKETCPICLIRDVNHNDPLDDRYNRRLERYFFQCRRCKQRVCAICIKQHFRLNTDNCPFCRYSGIIEGRSYTIKFMGRKRVRWIRRKIISTWDDSEINSESGGSDG